MEALRDALHELAAVCLRCRQVSLVLSFRLRPRLDGVLRFGDGLLVTVPDLPGCMADGETIKGLPREEEVGSS